MTSADDQQETFPAPSAGFYYTGFCAGEMSCSIIKATDKSQSSFYYTLDFTVTNKDRQLLEEVNAVIASGSGVITRIWGGYNLSMRGREKVGLVLDYFESFPIIVGDLARSRLAVLQEALRFQSRITDRTKRSPAAEAAIEHYRSLLRRIKESGQPLQEFDRINAAHGSVRQFLAGVMDAEGSIGFKKRGRTAEPFFAIAMKDRKIIELFPEFLGFGSVRHRGDGLCHYEVNSADDVLEVVEIFFHSCRRNETKVQMEQVRRILND